MRLKRERLDRSELAAGVRRHYRDDDWFHASEAFLRASAEATQRIAATPDYAPALRGWFLGHVLVEMLVDRCLIRAEPSRLDDYYAALESIDRDWLLNTAQPWLTGPATRLGLYFDGFRAHRYLYGYLDDEGLFRRLRGLARRVGLPALPGSLARALPAIARLVEQRLDGLTRRSAACGG